MSHARLCQQTRGAALVLVIGAGVLGSAAAGAQAADPTGCDASALRLSVLGATAIDPIHANGGGGAACADSDGTLLSLPALIADVDLVAARTRIAATVPKSATSTAEVTGATVGVAGPVVDRLVGPLLGPVGSANSIVGQVNGLVAPLVTSINGLLAPLDNALLGGLVPTGFDLQAVLTGLTRDLPGMLTTTLPDVLDAGLVRSTAAVTCSASNLPQLSGGSQLTGVRVLGSTIDANGAADRVLSLDTQHLLLGQVLSIDDILRGVRLQTKGVLGATLALTLGSPNTTLYAIVHGEDGLLGLVDGILTGAGLPSISSIVSAITTTIVQPALNTAPVNLPTGLLRATVTPNEQTVTGDQLTQTTLKLSVTALGQPILSGAFAQSHVSGGGVDCTPPVVPPVEPPVEPPVIPPVVLPTEPPVDPPARQPVPPVTLVQDPVRYSSPEAEAVLRCSKAPATLIDVYGSRGRTIVQGVAEKRFVGQRATIVLAAGNRKVGTTVIDSDGLFATKVALPPARIRTTNRARYYAVVGGRRTQALKFSRRMLVTTINASRGTVTLKGQVTPPRKTKQDAVVVKLRLDCTRFTTVARVKPDAKGRFTARIKAPTGQGAAIYRAQSRVPAAARSRKLNPTFTLPRVVGL